MVYDNDSRQTGPFVITSFRSPAIPCAPRPSTLPLVAQMRPALRQAAAVVEVVLERLAGVDDQRYLAMLEALAAPDDQCATAGRENHIGELEGGDLANAWAGIAHQADERGRQPIVACEALLGG